MELSFYSIKLFRFFTAFVIKILTRRTQYHIQLISDIFLTKPSDQNLAHCVSYKTQYYKVNCFHFIPKWFCESIAYWGLFHSLFISSPQGTLQSTEPKKVQIFSYVFPPFDGTLVALLVALLVWWDEWDGWDGPEKCPSMFDGTGGTVIKSVLQCSSYFVGI